MTLSKFLAVPALVIASLAVALVASANDGTEAKAFGLWGKGTEATVSIGARGNVLVRGATVTAVNGGDITATTKWGGTTLTWDVDTDADTGYVDASGHAISRADIETGDRLSFSGQLDGALSVDAGTVRDWSVDEKNDDEHLTGTVKSVGSGSFVLTTGGRSVTVDVNGDTDFSLGKDGDALADLRAGAKVSVTGEYDGDEFEASSVTSVTAKGKEDGHERPWRPLLDFFHSWKLELR
jgi:hypothetical protein